MENKAHAIAAGAFVLVVAALLALLAVWLTRDNGERHLYELSTRETLSGLQPQAQVRFRGVPVGKVEFIGFDHKTKGNVLVRISVDVGTPLTQSTFATVSSQGVTGLGFIQLEDDGPSTELLVPNDDDPPRIPLKPGLLQKLLDKSEVIMDQVEAASTKLNKLLGDSNQQALMSAVQQFGQAADSINKVALKLDPVVSSLPRLSQEASVTMKSLKTAADDVSRTANEVNTTAGRLNAKGGPLDKLAEGGAALTATVETFSAATLPRLGEVAEETARAMRQLRRTVNAVDDNPQSLIFGNGPPTPGPGEAGFTAPGGKP
ncbi:MULTISPECIES: MlaD family protein [unclassified Polaromonas]|jgi:phospholipid/cholesterol/gamma-HCH transport system substrate-binding protein|uniref:MlaD family protein n=1 Tax=unclassified Polaromonas TaxID=2638319 RepID=UPI000BDB052C|nr:MULTISPECIES: MlaD family protein [unclassified Polaromonas]OYY38388.1 MAG: mammalian cell entry protein [Polaromonas sp. 35-63-35]OYZ17477.1 MAG: mammalian cell entry protein [Polaromonas sp. 16-63-31]OYZ76733.1 MAG: mammalian cell entry protein [Polaromonas sp. 24-63-21]OZA47890.1 MAG: mammalian cell entry protein [Polaromonas sp. 17-63-33]OZA86007.1 MAG: mammalian cell entry protein [Polaromonas sp. 39-63-25]